jgi:hypothetical protein
LRNTESKIEQGEWRGKKQSGRDVSEEKKYNIFLRESEVK